MAGDAVKRDVLLAFEYSFQHEDWVCPLTEAIAGVTVQEAVWHPGPDDKSIWAIVLHIGQIVKLRERLSDQAILS